MLTRFRRLFNRFLRNSRTINNEPLNPVSLIIIILIDIFILFNVFFGLEDISQWYIDPSQAYPCYAEWADYQKQTIKEKDYNIVASLLSDKPSELSPLKQRYQQYGEGHLGRVSATCLDYANFSDAIDNPENQKISQAIAQKQVAINQLNQTNRTIREQYDSSLLEKLAGQPRQQSINTVAAEKAKQLLDENNRRITALTQESQSLKNELITKPESIRFLEFLNKSDKFREVEQGYRQSSFWHPSIQFTLQALFLLPLIFSAFTVHRFAQRNGYGLVSLISWHLLVIFFIPLILKIFQFLQVGVLFQFLFDLIKAIFGGLLFLVSYLYILLRLYSCFREMSFQGWLW